MSSQRALLGRKALILLVLQTAKSLTGRTKLQKILYLSNMCASNVIPDYKYYNYGPYSEMVSMEIENMRNNGWLEERSSKTQNDNVAYTYWLSRNGNEITNSLASKFDEKTVKNTIELVESLNSLSTDELEIMATLVFLREENKTLPDNELAREVSRLKPRFTEKQAKECLRIFNLLKYYR
ncbi:MAG: uncharacterized protein QG670_826 [Thermoproteota archaeon]|nr:uncharacterized protein [Thermoproteota archaeon]